MEIFPLPLFPAGGLSESVVTTVWVGVLVLAYFNLRLGWNFSGLIVPGYLVPLLLVKPGSAAVVVAEGVITYYLVLFLSEVPPRWAPWCSFFGRDRFFCLLLAVIYVALINHRGFNLWKKFFFNFFFDSLFFL